MRKKSSRHDLLKFLNNRSHDAAFLTFGIVNAHNVGDHSLSVTMPSGYIIPRCRPIINGPCDALRVNQVELPAIGTFGVVALIHGDIKNAIWLGAISAGLRNAFTTDEQSPVQVYQTGDVNFFSSASGFKRLLDGSANTLLSWPDGTTIEIGSPPTEFYGHSVSADGTRQVVPLGPAVTSQPQPFPITIKHASGTQITIGQQGAITIQAVSGQNVTIQSDSEVLIGNGSGEQTLVQSTFLTNFYNNHVHTYDSPNGPAQTSAPTVTPSNCTTTITQAS
jgi:hypothetical protein